MEKKGQFVQKRMFERISVNIQARFYYGNIFYSGKITNMSENGIFLQTRTSVPQSSLFPVIIRTDTMLLNILTRVMWAAPPDRQHCGVGLEIVNPSENYIEYTESIRPA